MSVLQNGHFQKCGQDSSHQNFSRWNLFFRSYGDHLIVVLLGGFLCITYLPYILHGGFIGDDWDVWSASFFDKTFWRMLSHRISWFAPQRPFQAYILTITGYLFKGTPSGYILVTLCLWIASLVFIAIVIRAIWGRIEAVLFLLIASIPVISSTTIFSPAATIVVPASIFCWSLSLLTLHHYVHTSAKGYYTLTYLLIIMGFLIYEIFLPFLVITILLPMYQYLEKKRPFSFGMCQRYVLKFVAPVLLVLIGIMLLHKFVAGEGATQIIAPNFSAVIEVCTLWGRVITSDFRNLLINSLFALKELSLSSLCQLFALMLVLLVLFFLLIKTILTTQPGNVISRKQLFFLLITCLSLLSCPVLFVLSGYHPKIFGYGNRLMASTWILLSILCSCISGKLVRTKYWGLVYFFICLCACSMIVQRDSYIQSWEFQQKIAQDCAQKVKESQVRQNAVIVGNVPRYLSNNLNNIQVFAEIWDFGYAVRIYTDGLIRKGIPITATDIRHGNFLVKADHFVFNRFWKPRFSIENLWYYEYNQRTESSQLLRIKNRDHLFDILDRAEKHGINEIPMRANKGIRTMLKKMLIR